jgi:mycothiol synthase
MNSELTIRPRIRGDDERLLEIVGQSEKVFQFTLESWRFHLDEHARAAAKRPVMRTAEVNGDIVGGWYVQAHYSGAGGVFFGIVAVDERHTRNGYGAALWSDTEAYLKERDVTKVYITIPDDQTPGKRFAEFNGFARTGRAERISRLTLAEANLEGYDGIEESVAAHGIELCTIRDVPTNDNGFMRELYDAVNLMVEDIPRTEENLERDPYETWRENFQKSPNALPDAYFLAMRDRHPIGMANLYRNGEVGLLNGLTGVVPTERHKGVARALKYKTVQYGLANGYEHIDTGNDAANAAMLSINIPLGYVAFPAREEWLKEY